MRFSALIIALLACLSPGCGGSGSGGGSKGGVRAAQPDSLWALEKGAGYNLKFHGILTAAAEDTLPLNLQIQAEVQAEGSATVLDKTGSLARLRLVLKERDLALRSSNSTLQKQLERTFVLPEKGESVELWFDVHTGRLQALRYRGKRYECQPVDAEFISLIAFPALTQLTRPFPTKFIDILGNTRAVMVARGPDPRGTIITNAIRFESEDGRGARGGMTTWQAFRLSPGRVSAAWGTADFDTRTAFPGSGLRGVFPVSWRIEYACEYTDP